MSGKIGNFFQNKTIFITGGTGFLGKFIVEKLLRSCNVKEVILLVRSKKNKSVDERVDELFNNEIFSVVKKIDENFKSKVKLVEGSLNQPNLGISAENLEYLKKNVDIVFHAAATTKMNEPIKSAAQVNIRGTIYLLEIAEQMENLNVVVYVSTAYSFSNRLNIEEKLYTLPMSTEELLNICDEYDDPKEMESSGINASLIYDFPLAYPYTKAHAEHVISNFKKIPTCIVRPSIILGTAKEPFPGYIDNLFSVNGANIGFISGIIRVGLADNSVAVDCVPVDYCVNMILTAAWVTSTERPSDVPIYNCVSSSDNRIEFGKYQAMAKTFSHLYPVKNVVHPPFCIITRYEILYRILGFLMETLPAFLVDLFLRILGKQPMMMKIYERIHNWQILVGYFMINEFRFGTTNMRKLCEKVPPEDRELFNFDISKLDWVEYVFNYIKGSRLYFFKESMSSLPATRRRFKRIQRIATILKFLIVTGFLYLLRKSVLKVLFNQPE